MKNIVTELSCINANILTAAQNLEKTDKLIIITDVDSSLPISLFELLSSLKVKPRFIPVKGSTINFMFTLGQISSECKDNMYLLFPDRKYINELERHEFQSISGEIIKLRVCDTFAEILKDKSADKKVRTPRKTKNEEREIAKKDEPEKLTEAQKLKSTKQENTKQAIYETIIPEPENTPVRSSLDDKRTCDNEQQTEFSEEEETTIAPAPKAFIVKIKNIIAASNQFELINTIMQHIDRIAHCYREATDCETGLAFLFDIYLSKLFDTDDLYDILYEHYDELKTLAQSAA